MWTLPSYLLFGRGIARVLDFVTERVNSLWVGVFDDFRQHLARFCFGRAGDREGVDANLNTVAVGGGLGLDIGDLLADLLGRVAVGEIPIGDP